MAFLNTHLVNRLFDCLIFLLFLIFFNQAMLSLWVTFTKPEFYQNGIAFLIIAGLYVIFFFRDLSRKSPNQRPKNISKLLVALITICLLYLFNLISLRVSLLTPVLFILGLYLLLGFYRSKLKRDLFIFLLLIACLPILERVQKFLGFPIRLLTAKIVSFLFGVLNIAHSSDSAIIISENQATSIDLPCSGVKSIYTGGIFMLATYYLQNVRLGIKLIILSLGFFLLLLFFNIWRVFSLVYIYQILNLVSFADTIHLSLGLIGFAISCCLLWYLTTKFIPKLQTTGSSLRNGERLQPTVKLQIAGILLILIFLKFLLVPANQSTPVTTQSKQIFTLSKTDLTSAPFEEGEKTFFLNSDVDFSKKYTGQSHSGELFSLLLVSSKSSRTHHDPETCLLGLGYEINNSSVFQIKGINVRRLGLNENQDSLIYWFVGKDKTILDYSQRVWEQLVAPGSKWVLIELGFSKPIDLEDREIQNLIIEVNSSVKDQLL